MANEKRLIDANALMDDVEMDGALYACLGAVEDVRFLVDSQPTVDAVEVVHGYWVATPIRKLNSKGKVVKYCDYYHCSECGTDRPIVPPYNYCPNCGAKMDGDGNA